MTGILSSVLMSAAAVPFDGGNRSVDSVLALLKTMGVSTNAMSTPAAGGTLAVNGQSVGSYDYVIKDGNQVVSSFTAADWFTSTQDSRSAIIVVKGNLTINAAQVFTPGVRKLFTALYVTGSLTVNGEISMTARGASHSASGANIAAVDIRLANGTYDGVSNPYIPATGGAGGSAVSAVNANGDVSGNSGASGSAGGTGGGGSGSARNTAGTGTSGAGSAGTCFTGGTGGGGVRRNSTGTAGSGTEAGGPGGNGSGNEGTGAGGGAGNPGGAGSFGGAGAGDAGTGGSLFIAVGGALLGTGKVATNGSNGGNGGADGGGSGGGSSTILCSSNSSSITHQAVGGGGRDLGGPGGSGTARILVAAP